MLKKSCLAVLLIYSALAVASASAKQSPKGTSVLHPFDYKGVTLTDSRWRWQMDEVRDSYLRVPNDDLLKGFRTRAGLPAPGVDLGGWYSVDRFHVFGQVVSGLSRMYAATGDPACRAKVDSLIGGWAKCMAPDGYFYYSDKPNSKLYTYEKMVCGLVDAHIYCGNKQALALLSRITDWTINNVKKAELNEEWYTLTENLYRAYLLSGDRKYLDYGNRWENTVFWGRLARDESIFGSFGDSPPMTRYHAYSHVNGLCGAAMAYRLKGDKWYLETLTHAYNYLQANQVYATGGFGPLEGLLSPETLPSTLEETLRSFEVQCGSWAGFKLSKYLIGFTGDARYGDWTERLLINGIGASVPTTPRGEVYYYANYNTGGAVKEYTVAPWPCCAGTRIQAAADYADLIYFRDDAGIYVNLFVPSKVGWVFRGSRVEIEQATRFPESEAVTFTVRSAKPASLKLSVRVPDWLARPMTAQINGKPVAAASVARHWAVFDRKWRNGDKLTIRLPMGFRLNRFPASSQQAFPAAVTLGPVVMAFRSTCNPSRLIKLDDLEHAFVPLPGEPLAYQAAGDPSILVRPYYAYRQGEGYYMYLNPQLNITNVLHGALQFSPGWKQHYDSRFTGIAGETVQHTFDGTRVRWLGLRHDDSGKAEVSIDGQVVDVVDQFQPGRTLVWESQRLSPGKHTIKIRCLGQKNEKSRGTMINVHALAIIAD